MQRLALAGWMVALAGKFEHLARIVAVVGTELLALRYDAVTCGVGTLVIFAGHQFLPGYLHSLDHIRMLLQGRTPQGAGSGDSTSSVLLLFKCCFVDQISLRQGQAQQRSRVERTYVILKGEEQATIEPLSRNYAG